MPRFVILEHDHPFLHWDLMLETGDVLRTWRLLQPPAVGQTVDAEASFDHRPMYLDYEGPISQGRGTVRRWDHGTYQGELSISTEPTQKLELRLQGQHLRGRALLQQRKETHWTFAVEPTPTMNIIHRASGQPERLQRLGPYQIESLIDLHEEAAGTVWRVRIEPHQRTSTSYHKIAEEYYFVLSGSGVAILNGQEYPLRMGDFLRLPPGTTHAFVTEAEPLEMLDIHTPGSRPDRDVYFVDETPEGFGEGQGRS